MVLAAGRGERMRPLTDDTAKPLLTVGGHALLDYHLHALAAAGVHEVIVNLSWQAARLRRHLGDGSRYGLAITFSDEGPEPLEAGGGIHHALGLLGPGPFLVANGDVWTDYPLEQLSLPKGSLAHLVLVANPPHHLQGDFGLQTGGRVTLGGDRLTYAGIAAFDPLLFEGCTPGRFALRPLLEKAATQAALSGEQWHGHWFDVGTPERLAWLDQALRQGSLRHPVLNTTIRAGDEAG